jgi:hypothetical protein
MALVGAGHLLALDIDGDDVLGRHLLEPHAAGLHQDAVRVLGRAYGDVPHAIVALPLAFEDAAGVSQLFAERDVVHDDLVHTDPSYRLD